MRENEKRKRGRPRKDGARRNRVQIKMSDEELEMFQYVCNEEGENMTNAFLNAIKMKYELLKYRK